MAVTSLLAYAAEDILTRQRETIHATRMKKYNAHRNGDEVPREVSDLANRSYTPCEVVERLVDLGKNEEGYWARLQKGGLPEKHDFTWAPREEMLEDIREIASDFFRQYRKKELAATAVRQLGISV